MTFKKIILSFILLTFIFKSTDLLAQTHSDQNGIKTSVTNTLYANSTQAYRYEIATVSYNSHHWQHGGLIIIELFDTYFSTGYEKYIVEIGYGQGTGSSSPKLKHTESHGVNHNAKITLGDAYDLSSSYDTYINKAIAIYLDIKYYSGYKSKITYLQNKVDNLTWFNEIRINENPNPVDIPDFTVSTEISTENDIISSGNLRVSGPGNHYIQNGNVGIGTTNPLYKLAVKGTIGCGELKVENVSAWPDFVFEDDYNLMPLNELGTYIQQNKHLPEIPTAADVKENGISVGEMNAKLLQKVEELTLYILQLENRIENLENK